MVLYSRTAAAPCGRQSAPVLGEEVEWNRGTHEAGNEKRRTVPVYLRCQKHQGYHRQPNDCSQECPCCHQDTAQILGLL